METPKQRIIVGVSGATGIAYAVRTLEILRMLGIETHLVVSKAGDLTRAYESRLDRARFRELADVVHPANDFAASIASGSFRTLGMIVVPCSVRSLAEIASGVTTSLLTRAADVVLKERRRLVLMVRETPLGLVHLRNMVTVTEAGAVVFPPVPAFYTQPQSVADIVDHTVGRALDLFGLEAGTFPRWTTQFRQEQVRRGDGQHET